MFSVALTRAAKICTSGLLIAVASGPAAGQEARPEFIPRPLSAFAMEKAERLIRDKLPCLGCHALDGRGGRIGPGLPGPNWRAPAYLYRMIDDPQGTIPGTIMPRAPMNQATRELIASYLAQRERATDSPPAVVPRIEADPATRDGAALFGSYCAVCHGPEGKSDGPNARFLPVEPAALADSAYLSGRPDDSLFDAIHSGGYIMGRSNRMPAYGRTLERDQIWSLVRHLRVLCGCEGPAWSRDGR